MGGLNNYQYAPNPISWIDPFGLTATKEDPSRQVKAVADARSQMIPGSKRELYRKDGRAPDVIFDSGFKPWNPDANVSIEDYVDFNEPSQYVGTSKIRTGATEVNTQTGQPGYLYIIDDPGHGIDVNSVYPDNPFAHEHEVAFPGGISPCSIKGCIPFDGNNNPVGGFIPNPGYKE